MNHLIIGITGGIGAGKSLVLRVLSEQFDTCLLRADDIANEMLAPGGPTWQFYKARISWPMTARLTAPPWPGTSTRIRTLCRRSTPSCTRA